MEQLSTTCVIAGGGPAGMMLGLLLARAGVDVTVLEKHRDFLRDFRGDTVHPSTLQLMDELGLLEDFLKLPHARIDHVAVEFGARRYTIGDFTQLDAPCKFIALMPQWDFLDFLAREAKKYPHFHLLMETEAKDLIAQGDRIAGVLAKGPKGNIQIRAGLTVAADGRHSTLREKSGLPIKEIGAPFDVLWLSLPHRAGDPVDLIGRIQGGVFFVMIYRGDYWQCAYGIPKGGYDRLRAEGIAGFRERLRAIAGFAADRADTIQSFDQVKLLTVAVNRLTRWARPGLLCIGDAAHAMSPAGGVGINLAIQDAVAAANILGPVMQKGVPRFSDLKKVQKRREFPTRVIQAIQIGAQRAMLAPTLRATGKTIRPPLFVKLFNRFPLLQRIPARVLGLGIRQEHVQLRRK
jgi:2-polyprenyl-6-methoxyphenol hydroxylase-like FAD-dependent oxidoreductase